MDCSDWELFVLNSLQLSQLLITLKCIYFLMWKKVMEGIIYVFFLVHSLPCGTAIHYAKSRNGLHFQMIKF